MANKRDVVVKVWQLGEYQHGGETYQRELEVRVSFHDGSWGGKRGYWLHVGLEGVQRRTEMHDGKPYAITSRLIGVGTGGTRHLLAEATRFNAKVLAQLAAGALGNTLLPGMVGMVCERAGVVPPVELAAELVQASGEGVL